MISNSEYRMKQPAKDIPTRKEWTRILAKTIACKAFLLDHASDSSMPNLIRKPTGVQADESMFSSAGNLSWAAFVCNPWKRSDNQKMTMWRGNRKVRNDKEIFDT
jgi:hypothetical protein